MRGNRDRGANGPSVDPAGTVGRFRRWVLLDGNRFAVAAGVALGVFVALLVAELAGLIPLEQEQPVYYVLSGLVSGNLTLITVVVSINQLLLSRQFESPGELEARIDDAVEYRHTVEEYAGRIAPVDPLGFLELLFENTRQEAQRIGGMAYGTTDRRACREVDALVETLTDRMDSVVDVLGETDADTFDVLSVTFSTNYAEQINRIRQVRHAHADELSETTLEALDGLVEHLRKVDVARQYFETVYLQEELSKLSRVLLYAGIPAELVSVLVLLGFTAETTTTLVGHERLLLPVAIGVGFLPLAILSAYIVRAATVTQWTAATIPFTTAGQKP